MNNETRTTNLVAGVLGLEAAGGDCIVSTLVLVAFVRFVVVMPTCNRNNLSLKAL